MWEASKTIEILQVEFTIEMASNDFSFSSQVTTGGLSEGGS